MQTISAHFPAVFTLGQAWRSAPEPSLAPTLVEAYFSENTLIIEAKLWDAHAKNKATGHNQRTWELGDTFEIFLKRTDAASYSEIHITPENFRLHLAFADALEHQRLDTLDSVLRDPERICSQVTFFPDGWQVQARIPIQAAVGDALALSFCRYDYDPARENPILSSSSPHPVCKFHRPEEWCRCLIG